MHKFFAGIFFLSLTVSANEVITNGGFETPGPTSKRPMRLK